jgi:hypothetical protein
MEMDDYLESFWDSLFYEISSYPVIVQILIALFCFMVFVYLIQIIILVIGLGFNLFKTKQTVKYLIIPFGFLLILVNKYKQLK